MCYKPSDAKPDERQWNKTCRRLWGNGFFLIAIGICLLYIGLIVGFRFSWLGWALVPGGVLTLVGLGLMSPLMFNSETHGENVLKYYGDGTYQK